jgi:hypothetical protein
VLQPRVGDFGLVEAQLLQPREFGQRSHPSAKVGET